MSVSVTVSTSGKFADSTTVKAYKRGQVPEQRRAPIGTAAGEGTTANGSVTIIGLEEQTEYRIGAEVSGKWEYIDVTTPKVASTGFNVVASANTITLPSGNLVEVTGTTEIKKITAGEAGKRVTLLFKESVKVVDGENLKLAGNFEATADDTLSIISNGTNWYETGRSAN